ncbi:MAG: glycosyltransferase [Clostridium sp.]
MKFLYVSCLCSESKYRELFKDAKIKPGQQVQKYHRLLSEGLIANGVHVKVLSALPITRTISKDIFINEDNEEVNKIYYNYIPIINIPVVKNILIFIYSFIYTMIECCKEQKNVVMCDVLNVSVSAGALLAAQILNRNSIGIVTDLPIFLSNKKNLKVKINNSFINMFKSYIFLTDEMNKVINKKNKPYTVIEGQVDIKMANLENNIKDKYEKKICMYTGGLQKIYGIKYLVEGFIRAKIDNSELHIFGNGDYEDELIEICRQHQNIKYFGVAMNNYVVKEQIKATLLINPRPTEEEYTKYSFPSKNMEYMVSGTPTLTTKLPGMPKEYNDYVYLIDDVSSKGIEESLKSILSYSKEVLHSKGIMAKRFVLEEKNNIVQTRKILDMIQKGEIYESRR